MRLSNAFRAALAAVCLFATPALAQNYYYINEGVGRKMACQDLGAVCFITHTVANSTGTVINPATSDQQAAQNTKLDQLHTDNLAGGPLAAATSGGCTPGGAASAATTNATSVKASAGVFCGGIAINTSATLYFLRLYNLATAPTCSSATGFVATIPIPASTTGNGTLINFGTYGAQFTTGIAYCLTGGGTSTDSTAAGTGVYLAYATK